MALLFSLPGFAQATSFQSKGRGRSLWLKESTAKGLREALLAFWVSLVILVLDLNSLQECIC